MNKIACLQAKVDILQAGLDVYEQSHPNKTEEEKWMVNTLTFERIGLSNLVDSLGRNHQTKTLGEWIDTYLQLGNVEDVAVSIRKADGGYAGGFDCSLSLIKDLLSPTLMKKPAYVTKLDEVDAFVGFDVVLDN